MEREKSQKFEYLENEMSFLDEIKNIFHSFKRAIIWRKNKNLIKIAGTSFKMNKSVYIAIIKHLTTFFLRVKSSLKRYVHA